VDNERNSTGFQDDVLPAPTPGQPRKTSKVDNHPYSRSTSHYSSVEDEPTIQRETEVISIHRQSHGEESEEEWQLRMRTTSRTSHSPGRIEKRSTSTTTTFYHSVDNDSSNDVENISGPRPKTPGSLKSGSGSRILGMKIRASPKRSGDALRSEKPVGVRKTSGRVGSVGTGLSTVQARKVSGL
jgi:cell division cycle 14